MLMITLFYVLSIMWLVFSVFVVSVSKGVFHEIEAILMLVCSTMFFVGGRVSILLEQIRDGLEEAEETRKIERMKDRTERKNNHGRG